MKKNIFPLLLTISIITLLTGCTQNQTPVTPVNEESAKTVSNQGKEIAIAGKKDLCKLLPIEKINQLTKTTYTRTESKFMQERATITDCTYINDNGQSVGIIANYDNGSQTAKEQFASLVEYSTKDGKTIEKVPGVGDDAFWGMKSIIAQINAVKGNVWITLALMVEGDAAAQQAAAIAVANEAFRVL